MHETVLVRLGERVGNRRDDVQDPMSRSSGPRLASAATVVPSTYSIAMKPIRPALVLDFVGFVDDGDVGMIEG